MLLKIQKVFLRGVIRILTLLVVSTILFIGVSFALNKYKESKINLAKSILLQAQTNEQFIVIGKKTCNITITKSENNEGWLKSLLLKHVVSVTGNVEVWYGYDLKKNSLDFSFDLKTREVIVKVQSPEILTAHLVYPVSYKTESGIIYKAFKEDKNKDLNEALKALEKTAISSTKEWLASEEGQKTIEENLREFSTQVGELSKGQVKVKFELER